MCFRLTSVADKLSKVFCADSKSWMQVEIMEKVLETLNRQMVKEEKNVILLLDNVTVHPTSLVDKFHNNSFATSQCWNRSKFQIKVLKEVNALYYCTCQRGFTSLRNCKGN